MGLRHLVVQMPSPLLQTVEHGFPNQPSALAFDPELRIMAIGTRSGAVKMYPLGAVACGTHQPPDLSSLCAGLLGQAQTGRLQKVSRL